MVHYAACDMAGCRNVLGSYLAKKKWCSVPGVAGTPYIIVTILLLWSRLFSAEHSAQRFLKVADDLVGVKQKKVCSRRLPLWLM